MANPLSRLPDQRFLSITPRLTSWSDKIIGYILKATFTLCYSLLQINAHGQPATTDSVTHYRTLLTNRYKIGVSAHRGNSEGAPENTLATFRAALTMQVDYLEIDVRTTQDGQLILLHDSTLDRTTDGTGPVSRQTLTALKKRSAGKGFGTSFQSEQIPTLEEVCQVVADWNNQHRAKTNLYVDCKEVAPEPLVAILTKYGLLTDAVFYGSDDYLLTLRDVAPTAKLMPSLKQASALSDKINKLHPYAFDLNWTMLSESIIRQIHLQGIRVFVDLLDAADTPAQYIKAAQLGIDVIQTDHVLSVYRTLN